jgi:hypothetical protein
MVERVDAATLDGLSKKELVVLVQSVAPLELLQAASVNPLLCEEAVCIFFGGVCANASAHVSKNEYATRWEQCGC